MGNNSLWFSFERQHVHIEALRSLAGFTFFFIFSSFYILKRIHISLLNNFGCSAAFVYPSEFALSFSWYWSILYSAEFTCYTFLFDFIYIYRGQDIVIPYSLHKLCCHSSYLLPPSSMVQASSQDTTVPPLDRKLTTLAELWQGHPGPLPPSPRFFFFWIPLVKSAKSLWKPVQNLFCLPS